MSKKEPACPGGPPKGAPEGTASTPTAAVAAPAAAATAGKEQQQQQQQQQRQQQGKGRKGRFQKNAPDTFTFRLLPASQQQLRHQAAAAAAAGEQQQGPRMQLQRVIPPNARKKPQQPLPEYLQQQVDDQDAAEEAAGESKRRVVEADLSRDCYFPQDGYDYSQHLVCLGGGTFLSHEGGDDAIAQEERLAAAEMQRDREARQVLAAMEACEDYEEIADDFVAAAVTDGDGRRWNPNEKELLWGCRPPLLPAAVSDRLFGGAEEGDSDLEGLSAGEDGKYSEEETEGDSGRRDGDTRARATRTADADDTQAQRLEQLLEAYRDECLGELEPEEEEDSDSFSAYDECFDDFLKSQERKPAVEVSRPGGPKCSRRRRDSSSSEGSSSSTSSSSSSFKREDDEGFRLGEIDDELKETTLALAKLQEEEGDRVPVMHVEPLLPARARPAWDGESIISARSGVSVQPRSIIVGSSRASKLSLINPSLGLGEGAPPPGSKGLQGPRRAQLPPTPEDTATVFELPEVSTYRPRGETPEERRDRKAKVKEAQRLLRANKKANKELLKEETKKAQAPISAFDVRPGVRYFRL